MLGEPPHQRLTQLSLTKAGTGEQVTSTYSDCFALDGSNDRMDQLPYYSVAEKLEKQNACLLAEQERFRQQLDEQVCNMTGLSVDIQVYLSLPGTHFLQRVSHDATFRLSILHLPSLCPEECTSHWR